MRRNDLLGSVRAAGGVGGVAQRAGRAPHDTEQQVLTLNDVNIMVGEFIPFGANHILSLNMKLG